MHRMSRVWFDEAGGGIGIKMWFEITLLSVLELCKASQKAVVPSTHIRTLDDAVFFRPWNATKSHALSPRRCEPGGRFILLKAVQQKNLGM